MRCTIVILAAALSLVSATFEWTLHQNIVTHGGNDWEYFVIDGESYLAVANFEDVSSEVYKWSTATEKLNPFQEVGGTGCLGLTYFNIDGNDYLAAATFLSSESYIYKWSTTKNQFLQYQAITVSQPRKWKFADIQGGYYLATTDETGYSSVYRWNNASSQFAFFQRLPLSNPQDLDFYNIGNQSYLAVANGGNASSTVYQWNGTEFNLIQTLIETTQGSDITAFNITDNYYLAFASLNYSATVFQWAPELGQYTLLQTISTPNEDFSVSSWVIDGQTYLGLATIGSFPTYQGVSQIFVWNLENSQFEFYQNLSTLYNEKFTYFDIEGSSYLAAAYATGNYSIVNLNSQIFKWVDN